MRLHYLTTLSYPSLLANRVQVIKMAEAFSRVMDFTLCISSMREDMQNIARAYGVRDTPRVTVIGSVRLWPRSFWFALRYARMIRRDDGDTYYYTRELPLAFFLLFVSSRFRRRFFFECHSIEKYPHIMYRRVFRAARGIISTNEGKRSYIRDRYRISNERLFVFPNGFDERDFTALPSREKARAELRFGAEPPIVMYIGSFQGWKGTDMVFKTSKLLPNISFMLIGGPDDQKRENVVVQKSIPHERVPLYLRAADVLVAPYDPKDSRTQHFFSPIKVFEYAASGTPIVATDLPVLKEILPDGAIAAVASYTPEAFADAVRSILNNRSDAEKHARIAQAHIARFSWEKRARGITEFLLVRAKES